MAGKEAAPKERQPAPTEQFCTPPGRAVHGDRNDADGNGDDDEAATNPSSHAKRGGTADGPVELPAPADYDDDGDDSTDDDDHEFHDHSDDDDNNGSDDDEDEDEDEDDDDNEDDGSLSSVANDGERDAAEAVGGNASSRPCHDVTDTPVGIVSSMRRRALRPHSDISPSSAAPTEGFEVGVGCIG